MVSICIIGGGFIGSTIARALEKIKEVDSVHIVDRYENRVRKLSEECTKVKYASSLDKVLSGVDLVVESASQEAVREYAPTVLGKGKDMVVLSVGAFVDRRFWEDCISLASNNDCKLYIPSGAIVGADGLNSASSGQIDEVVLISYKPPSAFEGVEYLKDKGVDLDSIERAAVLFSGNAQDAVRHFPKNINVAATISLAGIGFERTRIKIVADPSIKRNIHRLIVKGEFGEMECNARNLPSDENPKTSILAALSAISMVKKIIGHVWIGS